MSAPTQQLQRRTETAVTLRSLVDTPAYKNRFNELMRDRAPQFVASLVQLVNASQQLQQCEPNTIIAAAITAAALDLPIEKNLGFAYIVPYGKSAQFQMGYRGFVQLAIRSSQYKFLNVTPVREGELDFHNPLTSEIRINPQARKSEKIVGYAAYFRLVNGFEHAEYWDAQTVESHARRYSKAYKSDGETPWKTDFDKMAMKTVLKSMLSHWGILSVEMQGALVADESVRATPDAADMLYPDNPEGAAVKAPVFEAPALNAPQAPAAAQSAPTPAGSEPAKTRPRKAATPEPAKPAAAQPELAPVPEPEPPAVGEPAEPSAAGEDPLAPEPEPEPVQQAPAPQPAAGAPDDTLMALKEAMALADVTENQVLAFCNDKKLMGADGQPAKWLISLKANTMQLLTKNLAIADGPVTLGIKSKPV